MDLPDERGTPRRETGYYSQPRLELDDEVTWGRQGVGRGRGLMWETGGTESMGRPSYRATPGDAGQPGVMPGLAGIASGTPGVGGHAGLRASAGRLAAFGRGRGVLEQSEGEQGRHAHREDLQHPDSNDDGECLWRHVTQRRERRLEESVGRNSVACEPDEGNVDNDTEKGRGTREAHPRNTGEEPNPMAGGLGEHHRPG